MHHFFYNVSRDTADATANHKSMPPPLFKKTSLPPDNFPLTVKTISHDFAFWEIYCKQFTKLDERDLCHTSELRIWKKDAHSAFLTPNDRLCLCKLFYQVGQCILGSRWLWQMNLHTSLFVLPLYLTPSKKHIHTTYTHLATLLFSKFTSQMSIFLGEKANVEINHGLSFTLALCWLFQGQAVGLTFKSSFFGKGKAVLG